MKRTGADCTSGKGRADLTSSVARKPWLSPVKGEASRRRKRARVVIHSAGDRFLTLKELEREHIGRVLDHVNQNRTKAAEILGIDRVSLWRKIKRHTDDGCHEE